MSKEWWRGTPVEKCLNQKNSQPLIVNQAPSEVLPALIENQTPCQCSADEMLPLPVINFAEPNAGMPSAMDHHWQKEFDRSHSIYSIYNVSSEHILPPPVMNYGSLRETAGPDRAGDYLPLPEMPRETQRQGDRKQVLNDRAAVSEPWLSAPPML